MSHRHIWNEMSYNIIVVTLLPQLQLVTWRSTMDLCMISLVIARRHCSVQFLKLH